MDVTTVNWEQVGIITFLVLGISLLLYTVRAFVVAAWTIYQAEVAEKRAAIKLAQDATDRFGEALALIKELRS